MTIEKRLKALENKLVREQRFNHCLLVVLVVGVILMGNLAATSPTGTVPEVRARMFTLVDEGGQTRAVLCTSKDGTEFRLFDENCKPRAGLATGTAGPWLSLFGETGKLSATLHVGDDGPGLRLFDENGRSGVVLEMDKDGPVLVLRDSNYKVLWQAPRF